MERRPLSRREPGTGRKAEASAGGTSAARDLMHAGIDEGERVDVDAVETRLRNRGLEPRWRGPRPAGFRGLTHDSREVREGDLFCAISGLRTDGHDHVGDAARAGARAAVVEHEVPDVGIPRLVVEDTRSATAHLASLFHGDPSRDLRVTAVTGTDGKSTTCWLLRHLLSHLGPAGSLGTLGAVGPDGERRPGTLTTPGPVELARRLAGFRDEGAERVAMELSSHALDQRRADGLEIAALVLTNLSREHLDYHPDIDAYRAAKLRALALLRAGGLCVVNADEEAWAGVDPAGARRITYGRSAGADIRAEDVESDASGTRWRMMTPQGEVDVRLPLPGRFNAGNAMAAAAVALDEGLPLDGVAGALSDAPQVPGRMEVLRSGAFTVIRDYAHTPDALRRVLRELRPGDGRLLLVFGCGGDRDAGKRPLMGRVAGEEADLALVTTDNPRSEDPEAIADAVVEDMDPADYERIPDRRAAIARALEVAGPGDVVLLAGKGHETYQIWEGEREPFDEAAIVAELAGGASPAPGTVGERER